MKEHADLNLDNWVQESCSISAFTSDLEEPKTFSEAWNHQEPKIRNQWREAMKKELNNMECKNVWTEKQKNEIPIDRRLVGCKWVVKLKRDGAHRARLAALGYSQVPGIDFTESFAPVVNDVTFRIALTRMMVENLDSMLMDVETAFLYGDLDEEINMEVPVGLNEVYPNSINENETNLEHI